jgi:hypothetical protein
MLGIAEARYTCTSIVRRGDIDPGTQAFTNKFEEPTGVNAAGDLVFIGRAGKQQQTVYSYPNGGPNRVVARVADPAPGGSAYSRFAAGSFGSVSVNTSGNIAFFAKLTLPGDGIFIDVGGTVEKAAQTTDPTPNGGFFLSMPSVSNINHVNEVAFVANVNGAPNGIFAYAANLNALVTVVDTTNSDTMGRAFCSFGKVALAASASVIAFTASVANPTCATPLAGVFTSNGITSVPVVMAGDATPIGGTTYVSFLDAPQIGTTAVTFAASVTGATFSGNAIFSSTGPSKVVAVGDFAPDVTGAIKKLGGHRQDGNGDVIARLFLRQTDDKEGIFRYDATPEAAVVKTDAPPAPFGAGSKYRKIGPVSAAGTATTIAFRAKMKDTIKPGSKTGILRCVP